MSDKNNNDSFLIKIRKEISEADDQFKMIVDEQNSIDDNFKSPRFNEPVKSANENQIISSPRQLPSEDFSRNYSNQFVKNDQIPQEVHKSNGISKSSANRIPESIDFSSEKKKQALKRINSSRSHIDEINNLSNSVPGQLKEQNIKGRVILNKKGSDSRLQVKKEIKKDRIADHNPDSLNNNSKIGNLKKSESNELGLSMFSNDNHKNDNVLLKKDVDRLNELVKKLKDENDKLNIQNKLEKNKVTRQKQCLKDLVDNIHEFKDVSDQVHNKNKDVNTMIMNNIISKYEKGFDY